MTTNEKVIDLSRYNKSDRITVCDRKAVVCVSKENVKYLSNTLHDTKDDKLYCRQMFTDSFAEYQTNIFSKYNVLVLDIDELITFLASKSEVALKVREVAKADITTDKIAQTIALYFKQNMTEAQIIEKMRSAKMTDDVIAKYFPNSFKVELAF